MEERSDDPVKEAFGEEGGVATVALPTALLV